MLRDPLLPGVEVLQAHFLRYRYAPHWHDAVCVALVGRGAAAFDCARRRYLAPAGSAFVIPAYEIHTGEPAAPDGLGYDVLYITPERMAGLLEDAPARLGVPASGRRGASADRGGRPACRVPPGNDPAGASAGAGARAAGRRGGGGQRVQRCHPDQAAAPEHHAVQRGQGLPAGAIPPRR